MSSSHFSKLLDLIDLERRAEREVNKRELERYPVEMRETLGKTATRLTLKGQDTGVGGYPLLILTKHLPEDSFSPFQAMSNGDIVLLTFPGAETAEGTVYRVEDASITVALDKTPPENLPAGPYQIDLLGSDATYYRMSEALEEVKNAKFGPVASLRDIFLGERKARIGKPQKIEFLNNRLNEFQKKAVEIAMGAPEVALVHGPPGTGKTTVLTEVIRQSVKKGMRVLASAPSNIAVDNMLEKLLDSRVRAVRLGHPARISEALRHATLDALIDADPMQKEIKRLNMYREKLIKDGYRRGEVSAVWKDIRSVERTIMKAVLGTAQVVLATHGGLSRAAAKKDFDLVIMDEASQATEPLSWIPLTRAKKAVFAGDVCQLPPTIYSEKAAKAGLSVTLLERLRDVLPKGLQTLLRYQYRMHERIMEFPSSQLYEGKLIADETVKSHLLSGLEGVDSTELTTQPLLYADTAGSGWEEGWNELLESRENKGEAQLAIYLYRQLRSAGVAAKQIGILTPYVAQVRLLKGMLQETGLEIGSVDGFQGREKEAVILSLVRSNEKGEVGFLSDTRRMNVGMTRSRRLLIVIGDSATIGRHPFYEKFLEYAESCGAHHSSYEWHDKL